MEKIKSLFDLYNRKETGLSRTLACLFYSDYRVIREIIKGANFKFKKEDVKTLEVYYEPSFGSARFDILCLSKNYAIVIETKIGLSTVGQDQMNRYLKILENYSQPKKILILLTQYNNQIEFSANTNVKILYKEWKEIYEVIKKYNITINIADEFDSYLTGSQNMKISDIDIWAVVINKDAEIKRIEEDLVYRNDNYHQPIFIGIREWDTDAKKVLIKKLYPVKEIIPPKTPRSRIYNSDDDKAYIYVLDNPLILKKPIYKKFNQNSAISVSFSDLEFA